jgi:hypothetical protein
MSAKRAGSETGDGDGSADVGKDVIGQIRRQVEKEPYAEKLGLRLLELEPGRAVVEMTLSDPLPFLSEGDGSESVIEGTVGSREGSGGSVG